MIKGENINLFLFDTEAGRPLSAATEAELDLRANMIEKAPRLSADSAEFLKGNISFSVTSQHMLCLVGQVERLKTIKDDGKPVKIALSSIVPHEEEQLYDEQTMDGNIIIRGEAFIASMTTLARVGGVCTLSIQLTGTGKTTWGDEES